MSDNIAAAMEQVGKTLEMTRHPNTKSEPGDPARKQVIVRISEDSHARWVEAAAAKGVSMAEMIRAATEEVVKLTLDCSHFNRKTFPWSDVCLDCGLRFK